MHSAQLITAARSAGVTARANTMYRDCNEGIRAPAATRSRRTAATFPPGPVGVAIRLGDLVAGRGRRDSVSEVGQPHTDRSLIPIAVAVSRTNALVGPPSGPRSRRRATQQPLQLRVELPAHRCRPGAGVAPAGHSLQSARRGPPFTAVFAETGHCRFTWNLHVADPVGTAAVSHASLVTSALGRSSFAPSSLPLPEYSNFCRNAVDPDENWQWRSR